MIGYGAMLMESFVAIMAMIAARSCSRASTSPSTVRPVWLAPPWSSHRDDCRLGVPGHAADMHALAHQVGEDSLLARTGGAPSLAVGMAHIFANTLGGSTVMSLWYHFAIMFEALFILTTLDAGTRVGRFMLQDVLGHVWEPLGRVSWYPSVLLSSGLMVGAWGYFLYQGVIDPLGDQQSVAAVGISNQLLAAIALSVATTLTIKAGRARYAWTTLLPLSWLLAVTLTGGYEKIFNPNVRIGFLAHAAELQARLATGQMPAAKIAETEVLIFNDRLRCGLHSPVHGLVVIIVVEAARSWYRGLMARRAGTRSRPGGCRAASRRTPPITESLLLSRTRVARPEPQGRVPSRAATQHLDETAPARR